MVLGRRLPAMVAIGVSALAIVLGAIDGLVWMPEAVAPTTPLPAVYAALERSGNLRGCIASIVLWVWFWSFPVALAAALVCLPDTAIGRLARIRPLDAVLAGTPLLLGIVFFHFLATFGMGMSVSDELPPGVGRNSSFGDVYYRIGLLLGATGSLALGVRLLLLRRRVRRVPAPATDEP